MQKDYFGNCFEDTPATRKISSILNAAINAVSPKNAVERSMVRDGDRLNFYSPADHLYLRQSYSLTDIERVRIVAFGKAAAPMAAAATDLLEGCEVDGVVISKVRPKILSPSLLYLCGSHPTPDDRSVLAGTAVMNCLKGSTDKDLVLFLISGGGSSLVTAPAGEITVNEIRELTTLLLASGATINEINAVRKQIDLIKGGGLAAMAQPAKMISLILSDVIGNSLDVIASGPTVHNSNTTQDAMDVLTKYALVHKVSPSIIDFLRNKIIEKRDLNIPPIENIIIADNDFALDAAVSACTNNEILPIKSAQKFTQDVRTVAENFYELCEKAFAFPSSIRPFCLMQGGESTVRLRGVGLGGRNQHLALLLAKKIAGYRDIFVICLATDGEDGPTEAAGAYIDGNTISAGIAQDLNVDEFLQNNDSYHYLEKTHRLLKIGSTETNVNDLLFFFAL